MKQEDFLSIEQEVIALFPVHIKPAIASKFSALKRGEVGIRLFTRYIRRALFNNTDKRFSEIKELLERKQYYNKNYGEDYYENKIQHSDSIG